MIMLVVTSAIGLYYYLRIVVAMYGPDAGTGTSPETAGRCSRRVRRRFV